MHICNIPHLAISENTEQTMETSFNLFDLFKTSNLRKNTLIQYFNWFTTALVYYGLTFGVDNLIPGNMYLNFSVSGLIEFPAYIFCLVRIDFLILKNLFTKGVLLKYNLLDFFLPRLLFIILVEKFH